MSQTHTHNSISASPKFGHLPLEVVEVIDDFVQQCSTLDFTCKRYHNLLRGRWTALVTNIGHIATSGLLVTPQRLSCCPPYHKPRSVALSFTSDIRDFKVLHNVCGTALHFLQLTTNAFGRFSYGEAHSPPDLFGLTELRGISFQNSHIIGGVESKPYLDTLFILLTSENIESVVSTLSGTPLPSLTNLHLRTSVEVCRLPLDLKICLTTLHAVTNFKLHYTPGQMAFFHTVSKMVNLIWLDIGDLNHRQEGLTLLCDTILEHLLHLQRLKCHLSSFGEDDASAINKLSSSVSLQRVHIRCIWHCVKDVWETMVTNLGSVGITLTRTLC
eukprot:TRINITY_DN12278_c0_g1_i1.p1 TRINITY_DN12278_c0_g1~~TRINITY_DN12278_c0_g1_i1.p1  ORF type:complete len:329 (+),score=-21.84 TRINITY_DN12278_c0_g1_i1:2-988(+)